MVFYFTGTGNSLYIAKKLDVECVSIPQIINEESLVFSADKIGIVCPIYGHEMPALVKEFLCKARLDTDYLYLILTYGARHANAVELAQNALVAAKQHANYITTLLMVDNFLPVFDMNEEMQIDKNIEPQLQQITTDISAKKRSIQEVTQQEREMHEGYLRRVNGADETVWSKFLVTDKCIGCGICTKVCPSGCIRLENKKAVYSRTNCQACYACIHACAEMAIGLEMPEKNSKARYRNENISLSEIIAANDQTQKGVI